MLLGNTSADGLDDGCCWMYIKILPCCLYAGIVRARMWQMSPDVLHVVPSQHVWRKWPWVMTHLSSSLYFFPLWHSKDLSGSQNSKGILKSRLMASVFTLRLNDMPAKDKQGTSWATYQSWHYQAAPCYGLVHEKYRLVLFSSLADRASKSCHLLHHIREDVPTRAG